MIAKTNEEMNGKNVNFRTSRLSHSQKEVQITLPSSGTAFLYQNLMHSLSCDELKVILISIWYWSLQLYACWLELVFLFPSSWSIHVQYNNFVGWQVVEAGSYLIRESNEVIDVLVCITSVPVLYSWVRKCCIIEMICHVMWTCEMCYVMWHDGWFEFDLVFSLIWFEIVLDVCNWAQTLWMKKTFFTK